MRNPVQTTDTVLMVKPAAFGYNEETSVNNHFQTKSGESDIPERARQESEAFIALLEESRINVIAVEDTPEPHTPDSVFPNNWFSTHEDGTLVLYPMFAPNRRLERKPAVLEVIKANFNVKRTVDLTYYEKKGLFLEGTGSMVLDRVNRIAYACRSPRTSAEVLENLCGKLGYEPLLFDAFDTGGTRIYHTNVMMSIGTEIAVICQDSIRDPSQSTRVRESLEKSGRTVMEISLGQMNCYAGNLLEIRNRAGEPCLILSLTAYCCLSNEQRDILKSRMKLIIPSLECIEKNGGGSARCILAELF